MKAQKTIDPNDWETYISMEDGTSTKNGLDVGKNEQQSATRRLFHAFWEMAMPYFRENATGRCRFIVLILLMLANSAVLVLFSFLARDFWTALGDQNEEEFYNVMKQFLIALLLLAPINVFYRFQKQRLGIHWREWMTNRILELYYSNKVYYNLERYGGSSGIDNPDQRIAEDVKSFTIDSLNFFLTIAVSVIDLLCFSVILYSIEPQLFVSILGFCVFGTIITFLIGKSLVALNFKLLQKEANFRYSLVRIRDNAESIAFFRGEKKEAQHIERRFDHVISNAKAIIGTQRNLDLFTTLYNYLTWILPIIVIAPEYFAGNVDLGVVQQSASAFSHVLDDLSLIINQFESLTAFSASIDRLFQFVMAIKSSDIERKIRDSPLMRKDEDDPNKGSYKHPREREVDGIMKEQSADAPNSIESSLRKVIRIEETSISTASTTALRIQNLCLVTPDSSKTLIDSLSIDLPWNQNLLIFGESGVGKTSLIRAIAGIWTCGSGTIERPFLEDVYFLAQKPYCPLGTLRDQLLYPMNNDESVSNKDLFEILTAIGLSDLATRLGDGDPFQGLDRSIDWGNTLSLGEQQRLAFGRILVNKPRLAIFDESTSAMDVSSEGRMYRLLQERMQKPFTYISVGHRPTLLGFHDLRLQLKKTEKQSDEVHYSLEQISS